MYFLCMFIFFHLWFRQITCYLFGIFKCFCLWHSIWGDNVISIECDQMRKVKFVPCNVEGTAQPIHSRTNRYIVNTAHGEIVVDNTTDMHNLYDAVCREWVFVVGVFRNNERWEAYSSSSDDSRILFLPFVILMEDSYFTVTVYDHCFTFISWPLRTASN